MEPFVEVFFGIDKNHSENITLSELQDYVNENNLDHNMIGSPLPALHAHSYHLFSHERVTVHLPYQCTIKDFQMEPFVEVFFGIDKNHSENITLSELQDYVNENHLDHSMIGRWKALFDPEDTGKITLDKFCEVLGLKPAEARLMRVEIQRQTQAAEFGPDVTILAEDMPVENEKDIVKKTRELKAKYGDNHDALVKELRNYLEMRWDKSWNVVITDDSFWMEISYAANSSFHFRLEDLAFLMWMTPDLV
ncbi:putative tegumental protein Sm 20.8 [Fasciola hepatica]|uniref:Tegumental protein Sm 20.8 n=1 Tax=Fasciola hepatica TaxID=6192 RepID=A0A4E0RV72_FASHE|nr:putative tegumental protein Sm 20.8 [Fasciola hepatica]